MKRILIGVATALLLIASSGLARVGECAEVEAGIKMWLNDWHRSAPGFVSITSDNTMLLGPAIEVMFPNHVFAEASYLLSTADYKFSAPAEPAKFDRQDVDLAVGYLVVPGFGFLLGYKNTSFHEQIRGTRDTVFGPLIGIRWIAPVDVALSFDGRLNYLFTKFEETDPEGIGREDSPGWTFEFGVRYAFTREFSGRLGYKYETNTGKDSDVRDSFSGLTFGGMFTF
jgi:opacity protein-like surface antigen